MTFDMTTQRVTDAERTLAEELGTTNLHLVRYLGRLTERVEYLEGMVVRLQDGVERRIAPDGRQRSRSDGGARVGGHGA
jgi:hypothetical protein